MVVAAAHYGDWESACHALALAGFPLLTVAEPMPNRLVERFVARLRAAAGNRAVAPRFALLKLMRGLRNGERVAMMADVNGRRGRGGVWLDFFGLRVFNGAALAELALRTGSAVAFVAAESLPAGRTRLSCRLVEPVITGNRAVDVRSLSQQVLDHCRDLIRADPEPWLWTYKRWKRRPTPEQGAYPFYSKHAPDE